MKHYLSTSFITLFACIPIPASGDLVRFKNQDAIAGQIVSVKKKNISILTKFNKDPLILRNENLSTISFDRKEGFSPPAQTQFIVLKNQDHFAGTLASIENKQITFKTWFSGDIKVNKDSIHQLKLTSPHEAPFYKGPNTLKDWTIGHTRWSEYSGNISANQGDGYIGRDLKLPESFTLKTKIRWTNYLDFIIEAASTKPGSNSEEHELTGYRLLLRDNTVTLSRPDPKQKNKLLIIAKCAVPSNQVTNKDLETLVDLRIDRQSRKILIFLNNNPVIATYDPLLPPSGTCVNFAKNGESPGDISLRSVSAANWDGSTTPAFLTINSSNPDSGKPLDIITTLDHEIYKGTIIPTKTSDQPDALSIRLDPSEETISVPISACHSVTFAGKQATAPPSGDFRYQLIPRGQLTLSELTLDDEKVYASHNLIGKIEIHRDSAEKISLIQKPSDKKNEASNSSKPTPVD